MQSIERVIKSMRYGAHKGSYEPILRAWAEEIIDECAMKANIMIDKHGYGGKQQVSLTWYEIDDNESIHVDSESIERVKQQL